MGSSTRSSGPGDLRVSEPRGALLALASSALVILGACGGAGEGRDGRPNVLVVYTDDQRFDSLSISGNPYIQTPHLDRIATEGALFERAYVTTSRCCPGRASFLTGKYATAHGVWGNHPEHDFMDEHRTIADLLDETGYETAWLGKWHLPNPGAVPVRSFDHWVSYEGPGSHFDQAFNVDGKTVATAGFQADRLTDLALEFLDRDRSGAPFFLVLAFKNPHVPMTPAPRHAGSLDGVAIARPASAQDPFESLPAFVRRLQRGTRHAIDWDSWERNVRAYWELCLSIDDNVGRVLDHLEASGELDRTLVILTTDNGQLLGEHGVEQKGVAYEPSIRVPLAMRWPEGVPAGARVGELALNVDLLPTILAAAGQASPADVHGRSLFEIFDNGAEPWRENFLSLLPNFGDGGMVERALVGRRWKLVVDQADGFEETWLYDLEGDPDERVNQADDPANGERVRAMREILETEDRKLRQGI